MARDYTILDVFTDTALAGNPLAVVHDGAGLDGAAMQAIAGEFNLSETVFVLPADDPAYRASLRIFTPKRELPFAGHPTVGTAILLARRDGLGDGETVEFVLEENIGSVACKVSRTGQRHHCEFVLPALPKSVDGRPDPAKAARALGLAAGDIGLPGHEGAAWDAGVPFPVVPVATLDAMGRIALDSAALAECMGDVGLPAEIYVYTNECERDGAHYHARMFAPAFGIAEDPATGAATAAFAGQVMAAEKPGDGEHRFVIEQGFEMGRPSILELTLIVHGGELVQARIGGDAVVVANGTLLAA